MKKEVNEFGTIQQKDAVLSKVPKADKIAFFICLFVTIGLFVGGFFAPPTGVIDGSVLTAGGIILSFAVVAVGAQAVADGRRAIVKAGNASIELNDNDE